MNKKRKRNELTLDVNFTNISPYVQLFVWATLLYLQFKFEGSRKVDLKMLVKLTAVVFNLLRLFMFMLDMSTYGRFHRHFMSSYCTDFFAHTPKINQNFSCSFDFWAKKLLKKCWWNCYIITKRTTSSIAPSTFYVIYNITIERWERCHNN